VSHQWTIGPADQATKVRKTWAADLHQPRSHRRPADDCGRGAGKPAADEVTHAANRAEGHGGEGTANDAAGPQIRRAVVNQAAGRRAGPGGGWSNSTGRLACPGSQSRGGGRSCEGKSGRGELLRVFLRFDAESASWGVQGRKDRAIHSCCISRSGAVGRSTSAGSPDPPGNDLRVGLRNGGGHPQRSPTVGGPGRRPADGLRDGGPQLSTRHSHFSGRARVICGDHANAGLKKRKKRDLNRRGKRGAITRRVRSALTDPHRWRQIAKN